MVPLNILVQKKTGTTCSALILKLALPQRLMHTGSILVNVTDPGYKKETNRSIFSKILNTIIHKTKETFPSYKYEAF